MAVPDYKRRTSITVSRDLIEKKKDLSKKRRTYQKTYRKKRLIHCGLVRVLLSLSSLSVLYHAFPIHFSRVQGESFRAIPSRHIRPGDLRILGHWQEYHVSGEEELQHDG